MKGNSRDKMPIKSEKEGARYEGHVQTQCIHFLLQALKKFIADGNRKAAKELMDIRTYKKNEAVGIQISKRRPSYTRGIWYVSIPR